MMLATPKSQSSFRKPISKGEAWNEYDVFVKHYDESVHRSKSNSGNDSDDDDEGRITVRIANISPYLGPQHHRSPSFDRANLNSPTPSSLSDGAKPSTLSCNSMALSRNPTVLEFCRYVNTQPETLKRSQSVSDFGLQMPIQRKNAWSYSNDLRYEKFPQEILHKCWTCTTLICNKCHADVCSSHVVSEVDAVIADYTPVCAHMRPENAQSDYDEASPRDQSASAYDSADSDHGCSATQDMSQSDEEASSLEFNDVAMISPRSPRLNTFHVRIEADEADENTHCLYYSPAASPPSISAASPSFGWQYGSPTGSSLSVDIIDSAGGASPPQYLPFLAVHHIANY